MSNEVSTELMPNDEEDVSNESSSTRNVGEDPDAEVLSDDQPAREFAPYMEPRVSKGAAAEAQAVAPTLDESGLELLAQRVLSRRGVDIANPEDLARTISPDTVPLFDILDASLPPSRSIISKPPIGMESVLGFDERERIVETKKYPFSAIAALEITAADNSRWVGTGWFITPRILITAGHCVFIHNPANPRVEGWVRSIRVIPGRNGTGPVAISEPFGSVLATSFRSVSGWVKSANAESDYGAIFLPDSDEAKLMGAKVGTFGFATFADEDLKKLPLNIAGYPTDKVGVERQTMWYGVKNTAYLTANQIFYDIDTFGGQSGAPVYISQGDTRVAVAIHAYGTSAGIDSNSGTRITQSVFDRIEAWKRLV